MSPTEVTAVSWSAAKHVAEKRIAETAGSIANRKQTSLMISPLLLRGLHFPGVGIIPDPVRSQSPDRNRSLRPNGCRVGSRSTL